MDETVFTHEGLERLNEELDRLRTSGRRDIAELLRQAVEGGAIRESADYLYAREEQAQHVTAVREGPRRQSASEAAQPVENEGTAEKTAATRGAAPATAPPETPTTGKPKRGEGPETSTTATPEEEPRKEKAGGEGEAAERRAADAAPEAGAEERSPPSDGDEGSSSGAKRRKSPRRAVGA